MLCVIYDLWLVCDVKLWLVCSVWCLTVTCDYCLMSICDLCVLCSVQLWRVTCVCCQSVTCVFCAVSDCDLCVMSSCDLCVLCDVCCDLWLVCDFRLWLVYAVQLWVILWCVWDVFSLSIHQSLVFLKLNICQAHNVISVLQVAHRLVLYVHLMAAYLKLSRSCKLVMFTL